MVDEVGPVSVVSDGAVSSAEGKGAGWRPALHRFARSVVETKGSRSILR
jgi:hypothetical protein